MSFRIALQCRRAIASLGRPHEVLDQSYEFFLAERRSGDHELLLLGESIGCSGAEGRAPTDLPQMRVMIGRLISRGPEPGNETFLLERHIPGGLKFRGLFLPADGYLRLRRSSVGIVLSGVSRLSSLPGYAGAPADQTLARALADGPDAVGCVQHLDGAHIPWDQEKLPHDIETLTEEGVQK